MNYTNAALVESLVKNALGYGSQPELDAGQMTALLGLAMPDGSGSSETIQRAVVTGWGWKAALTSDQYQIRAASGAELQRQQWFAHCMAMADAYRSGALSADGETLGTDLSDGPYGDIVLTANILTDGGWA